MARAFQLHCTKLFLVMYNIVFVLCGAAILALGIWLHFDKDVLTMLKVLEETPSDSYMISTAAYVTIGVGTFILLVGFLGCCGACCESMCMLCLYTCLVFLVLLGEIVCGVLVGIFREKIEKVTKDKMKHQVVHEYNRTGNTSAITHIWDVLQLRLNCCGSTGPQDYRNSYFQNVSDAKLLSVPWTCCVWRNTDMAYPQMDKPWVCQNEARVYAFNSDNMKVTSLKTTGCHSAIQNWMTSNLGIVIGLVIGVIVLEVLGLVVACGLMASIRNEQSKYPWYLDEDEDDD